MHGSVTSQHLVWVLQLCVIMNTYLSSDTGVVLFLSDVDRLMKDKNGIASSDIKFTPQLDVCSLYVRVLCVSMM